MSFTIICDECRSHECRIETFDNGEFIEAEIVCDNCGHRS
jgi:hypothetical protein